jgi:GTPase involved in cell partitioning and DNA repair
MLLVASRIDAGGESDRLARLREFCREHSLRLHEISGVTGQGLEELKRAVWASLKQLPRPGAEEDQDRAEPA